jgi:hypothetical protein
LFEVKVTVAGNGAVISKIPIVDRVAPSWGTALNEADFQTLAASWISREHADRAMLRRVDASQGREITGQKGNRDCAGLLIPYYWPDEPMPFNYRVRRDNPEWITGKDGKPKPDGKYLSPPRGGNRLYIPPEVTAEQLQDLTLPLLITEGEKKALALWRLSHHETEKPRFLPVGIAGVWNWRGVVGKSHGPHGERIDVRGPIPDLSRVVWIGRKVSIVFDSNVATNDSVSAARWGISRELATRAAIVEFINLPQDCRVNGIDELLATWGPTRVLELFRQPVPGQSLQVVPPPQFQARPDGMFRVVSKGEHLSETKLTNYRASIKTSITLDDGLETKREFEIESELIGRVYRFTIPASQFTGMDWPIEQMGPGAITFPNQRDYARTAIQSSSLTAEERRTYTHTGWCNVEGHWKYLHAAGAIGIAGAVTGVNIRLSGSLRRYELRLPSGPEALISAIRASLRLVELGPALVSFPLRAATFRSVLGEADFSLHLSGETGAFKSERVALEQQHFGAGMGRTNLPGAWSSTGNALEVLAFHAKDALLVIDDFAPHGSTVDVGRYHAAADRVFRAAGNHAGRSRLDSTARLHEAKPPRGLILSTGEDVPRGHSIQARLLILELSRGDIKPDKLSECQRDAEAGLYAEALGAFVQWIAARYGDVKATILRRVGDLRQESQHLTTHARTPGIIANLQAGFELFLEFGMESGAINVGERKQLADRCWAALIEAAETQGKHQTATEPTERFLSLLRGCLTSGRAHLAARHGTAPPKPSPESCGWRHNNTSGTWSPQGECIGWIDDEHVYLEPTVTYRMVQSAAREGGDPLPVSEQTLRKRLREKGLLASTDVKRETLTVRKTIAGSIKQVLDLPRGALLLVEPDKPDD